MWREGRKLEEEEKKGRSKRYGWMCMNMKAECRLEGGGRRGDRRRREIRGGVDNEGRREVKSPDKG